MPRPRLARALAVLAALAALLLPSAPLAAQSPVATQRVRGGMVVSQSDLASAVGAEALRRGGNAVDAAVATAFALAVTHPAAGNIGGGGFLVVRLPSGDATTFDFREKAPLAADLEMFLGDDGAVDSKARHWSHLSAGVPGSVAGLELAHERLGKLPWADLVLPAIRLASEGFVVSDALAGSLEDVIDDLRAHPASAAQFTNDGAPLAAGTTLRQADLAATLTRIRDEGADGFYRGRTAELIAAEMQRGGGRISLEDLATYRAIERPPVRGTYRGLEVISMPPPSSGGVALIEMLHVLEGFDLAEAGYRSARETHLLVETMRRAFADRARHLGDPDFVDVPVDLLTSPAYADSVRHTIRLEEASVSAPDRFSWPRESEETTHLSVVDANRMAVSLTTTLERSYGCRIVVTGAGFLLNNEMGDFNPQPGVTDADGQIGTPPNRIEPAKRMLSSMTPTILATDDAPYLVIGSPGGRTIINTVLEVVVNVVDHGMSVQQAIDAPRFHHQWLPDRIVAERFALSPDTRARLEALGHEIVERRGPQGSAMGIRVTEDGWLEAGVDRRRGDAAAVGQ